MENIVLSVALPLMAFVAAWAIASWRAQKIKQRMHAELEVARAELERVQAGMGELQEKLSAAIEDKAAQDIACSRLEADRDNDKMQIERLAGDCRDQKVEIDALRQTEQQAREISAKAREAADKLNDQLEMTRTDFNERIEEKNRYSAQLEQKLVAAAEVQNATAGQLAESREELKKAQTQLAEKQESLDNYKSWWEQAKAELKSSEEKNNELGNAYARLKTSLDEKQQHFDEQLRLLQENREELKREFEHLASEILERKGKAFKELNQESITNLIAPIHNEMKSFKAKVEDIHSRDAEQRVQLRTELQNLQTLNKEITDQADKLTTALQGQKKVQGNWGELMLENVLDSSGLRPGTDYKREVSFTTEEGRQRPDAIVYLPQNQHLVIDAKTSLAAYTRYVNAENDLDREQALAAHARAVGDRVNELADRDYFKLPGLNSPEVVIMFIPIESAYVEALKYDETLFQRAIEQNVLVATPTTLLTSLNIVRQLWRFENQNKHTAELASRAEKFYNKLNGFLTSMQGVGRQLDKARESYDKAFGQLYSGRGNLIKQASEFKDLGVSVQKELPVELVERANLELGGDVVELDNTAAEKEPDLIVSLD